MARDGRKPGERGAPRGEKTRVKTAKGRSVSSKRWLERQLNDVYVAEAVRLGYRSRAAFKLAQIDDKYGFLRPGARIIDLGAAPGGWVQVALERVGEQGVVVGIDLREIDPIPGAQLLTGDFLDDDAPDRLRAALERIGIDRAHDQSRESALNVKARADSPGCRIAEGDSDHPGSGLGDKADAVLSDMAAPSTGHAGTDHLRIMALTEAAMEFALDVLAPGGAFVAKVLQGGSERELLTALKKNFAKVAHVKPPASRKESSELYVVATGFRGDPGQAGD